MADTFDPYYRWLAIPPEDQPPDHYRLLGIKPFESNSDVIDMAADRQMSHLRTFQAGPHSNQSQRMLNEVAAARLCLLNPVSKAAYDRNLRDVSVAGRATPPPISVVTPPPVPRAVEFPGAIPSEAISGSVEAFDIAGLVQQSKRPADRVVLQADNEERKERKKKATIVSAAIAGSLVLGGVTLFAVIAILTKPRPPGADAKIEPAKPPTSSQHLADDRSATDVPPASGISAGTWYDVTPWIQLPRDIVRGVWRWDSGGISGTAPAEGNLAIPVAVTGSYEVQVEFTRNRGNNTVGVMLPVGAHNCMLTLCGWDGRTSGVDVVDGHPGVANVTTTKKLAIQNGRRYCVVAKVSISPSIAAIEATIDDQPLIRWAGNEKSLSLYGIWRVPEANRPHIAFDKNTVTYHRVLFRLTSGTAKRLPVDLHPDHGKPMMAAAAGPAVPAPSRPVGDTKSALWSPSTSPSAEINSDIAFPQQREFTPSESVEIAKPPRVNSPLNERMPASVGGFLLKPEERSVTAGSENNDRDTPDKPSGEQSSGNAMRDDPESESNVAPPGRDVKLPVKLEGEDEKEPALPRGPESVGLTLTAASDLVFLDGSPPSQRKGRRAPPGIRDRSFFQVTRDGDSPEHGFFSVDGKAAPVAWKSSSPRIVHIDQQGEQVAFTFLAAGKATVSVTAGRLFARKTVEVRQLPFWLGVSANEFIKTYGEPTKKGGEVPAGGWGIGPTYGEVWEYKKWPRCLITVSSSRITGIHTAPAEDRQ